MVQSTFARQCVAAVVLAGLCAGSVFSYRGAKKPWVPAAPAYRQKGPADAKVVLVEFGDFQCPPCAAAQEPLKNIEAHFGGKLHFVFKHRPWFRMHRWAKTAATAAECAGRQGKFFELADVLFQHQREWGEEENDHAPEMISGYVKSIGVDWPSFNQCLGDPSVTAAIEADAQEAEDHWINSTPTFFINGERFVGPRQLAPLGVAKIEKILGK